MLGVLQPDLDQTIDMPALLLVGTLPNAKPGEAYEGRLQIRNQVGACQIYSVTGGPLPPGGAIYVDGDEVVVSWPAYSTDAAPLANPDFSTGDITGWTVTTKGELPGYPVSATASAARPPAGDAYSALWIGNEGNGHARGVEAVWANATRADAPPTFSITASAQIALDDTSTSQNRGRVRLQFFDDSDSPIGAPFEGNLIRGDNEAYRVSQVTAVGPTGSATVELQVWTTGNESPGSGVRFGAVQWDAPQLVGINVETTLCFTVTIRDSTGRTAPWSGCVVVKGISDFRWISTASPTINPANNCGQAAWSPELGLCAVTSFSGGVTTLYTSSDLVTFTAATTVPNECGAVTWSSALGMFVFCETGLTDPSPCYGWDGAILHTLTSVPTQNAKQMAYGGGYVAITGRQNSSFVPKPRLVVSADMTTYKSLWPGTTSSARFPAVAYGGGKFLAAGANHGTNQTVLLFLYDPVLDSGAEYTFNLDAVPGSNSPNLSVTYNPDAGEWLVSRNAEVWAVTFPGGVLSAVRRGTFPSGAIAYNSLLYVQDAARYVAISDAGSTNLDRSMISVDGSAWVSATTAMGSEQFNSTPVWIPSMQKLVAAMAAGVRVGEFY